MSLISFSQASFLRASAFLRPRPLAGLGALLMLSATGAQAEAVSYTIEPTHTFVTFEVQHFGTSTNRGRFDKKEGKVVLDRAAQRGQVDVSIDTRSINTGTEPFNAHLKKEFFESDRHPMARFVSDQFSFEGDKIGEVRGQLTLHGVSQPVVLKAQNFNCYVHPMHKHEVCGGDFETTIKRSDFGIKAMLPMVPDTVRLVIQVEAVRQ